MMRTFDFISELARQGIKLRMDGELLRINAPEGALSPSLVAQLKERKPEITAFLSEHEGGAIVSMIRPDVRPNPLPLSFSQQRLWFLAQLEGTSVIYNIPAQLRLSGPLDMEAFNASWRQIEERHEILRTTFPQVDGKARQHIRPPDFKLEYTDLSDLTEDQQESEIADILRKEAEYPFDLENGPLWRVHLLRLDSREHMLFVTMHHIISDGWSMGILTQELSGLYARQCHRQPLNLPDLPVQYADFAVWQREWLRGDVLQELSAYWEKKLAGAPALLTLPLDRPRPAVQSYRGDSLSFTLSETLTHNLKSLSQKHNSTLFMTLHAAFAVLLCRYSNQEDILVGTPTAGRQTAEIENLIGFFINTLVLRNDLSGNPTFIDFLARVRQVTLDAYQNQALPFELLVETLQPERTLSYSPIFQVMFVLQNTRNEMPAFADVNVSQSELNSSIAKFDLTLTMRENEDHLIASWNYNTDIFDRTTIERMAGHFQNLLEGITCNPAERIAYLPLLTEQEKNRILVEWNETAVEFPLDKCVHQLFEEQAGLYPESTALIFENERLTYKELNIRANQLAYDLIEKGTGPNDIVGVYLERSLDMIVGLLGILKAGAAYLPIDIAVPNERSAFLIEDVRAEIIVTRQTLAERLPENVKLICLDAEDERCNTLRYTQNPSNGITPESLAYIVFTSGSTGKPKGVGIEHRNLVNYVNGIGKVLKLPAETCFATVSTLAADLGNTSIFSALCTGGALLVMSEDQISDPDLMARIAQKYNMDCLKITPSHLQALMTGVHPASVLPRKVLVLGGEASNWDLIRQIRSVAPQCRIVNHYGPTETTIGVLTYPVKQEKPDAGSTTVPIGRPIANNSAYILDRHLQPVPIGVYGELHIGGAQVARGYLNRPELTDEKFIQNPFKNGRLYKTGDLCRFLPKPDDSPPVIEFLGRTDHQVKIRGIRVELGEIETLLKNQPEVHDALVVVDNANGNKRLIAYMVGSVENLAGRIGEKLPDYMVPSTFVQLDAMPLTPNGKIDRKALPAPEYRVDERQLVLPRTPEEETLVAIWQEVLGNPKIGVTDNFFQVGGDSIMSIQIVSRARKAGIRLTPKALFQHQTIAELAGTAGKITQTHTEQGVVTGSVPLTPFQHKFFALEWSEPHHWNVPLLLELPPDVTPELLKEAFRAILAHHDALRLRFEHDGKDWRQWIAEPCREVPFEVIDLSALEIDKQAAERSEISHKLHKSLDLSKGPLMCAALFRETKSSRLLIIIHRLAADGFSYRIILDDLQTAYQQLARGHAVSLPPKSTSYKQWATLLKEHGPAAVAGERNRWEEIHRNRVLKLPVDYCLGPNNIASITRIITRLDIGSTNALLHEAPPAYHTRIFDLLLAALLLAFQKWTGQSALNLELEGHGRENIFSADETRESALDLSRTVGGFATSFPVRLKSEALDPGLLIKTVKEQLRRVSNGGIGYGILRYLTDREAVKIDAPAVEPEMHFNYIGRFDPVTRDGLIKDVDMESGDMPESPLGRRQYLIDINSIVMNKELTIFWMYSRNIHREETIRQLAENLIDALQNIISHCLEADAGGYSPSDFPDADLDQEELDSLVSEITSAVDSAKPARKEIEAIYPLSPSQQGMLFETLSFPESGLHIEQSVFTWRGELDIEAFENAWHNVLARHSILRTGFAWEALEEPLQFVLARARMPIERHSTTGKSSLKQQEYIDRHIETERCCGFELMRPPLMRLTIFHTDENTYKIVWTRHHIITDGWSISIMVKDMIAFYKAECRRQNLNLSPARPYQDYISWLKGREPDRSEAFWREKLRGFTHPTPIATRMAPPDDDRRYAYEESMLSASVTDKLYTLGRRQGFTANTLIQAAWALVLNQHSGAADVLFGATVSGRPPEIPDVESIAGLFINTLPIRIKMEPSAGESLLSWLQKIQDHNIEQQSHSYCSTGQIHQWSQVSGSLPLYESLLVFENYPVGSSKEEASAHSRENFEIRDGYYIGAQTKYALTILVTPGDKLRFCAVYDTTRFTSSDISRLMERLTAKIKNIIESLNTEPESLLEDIIVPEGQRPTVYSVQEDDARRTVNFIPPNTEIERRLIRIWRELLGVESVGIRDSFFDLGGHSLVALRMMARIHQHFKVNLPLATLFKCPTIEKLALRLADPDNAQETDWSALVPIQSKGSARPFFCMPGGGGNVLYLHELARLMGMERPFYGLQAVGLDGETEAHTSIEAIAAHNIEAIRKAQPEGPYLLGGHSFGGIVAYEMAQQFLRAGYAVARLIILDSTFPIPRPESALDHFDDAQWMVALATDFSAIDGQKTSLRYEDLQLLDYQGQLNHLKQELERLQILPMGSDIHQTLGWIRVYKNNMMTNYVPYAKMPAPMTLFRADQAFIRDSKITGNVEDFRMEPAMGWDRLAENELEVIPVPGDHLTMLGQPNVSVLAQRLADCLSRSMEKYTWHE